MATYELVEIELVDFNSFTLWNYLLIYNPIQVQNTHINCRQKWNAVEEEINYVVKITAIREWGFERHKIIAKHLDFLVIRLAVYKTIVWEMWKKQKSFGLINYYYRQWKSSKLANSWYSNFVKIWWNWIRLKEELNDRSQF